MPRMIDLIRASAVPATLVQSAARGALAMPQPEMLEILVCLATENKVFSEQASLTLAGWDEAFCRTAAANPSTPKPVLSYFADSRNFRPALFPALLANPAVPEESLATLALSLPRDLVDTMLQSGRANHSQTMLAALASNPNLNGIQSATIDERLALLTRSCSTAEAAHDNVASPSEEISAEASKEDQEADEKVTSYLAEHASEISAEAEKPFQPIGGIYEELSADTAAHVESATSTLTVPGTAGAAAAVEAKMASPNVQHRGSALAKISKLDIKGRIQLAMKGTKEERSLLVRDGTKLVALAVLDSPKISDGEVEKVASQKNVLEAVLRAIPMRRRYMKQYNVVRNLVFNPRTPIDVSLTLMKNIMVADLKNLSGNKEVSETVRKSALRLLRTKLLTTDK